MRKAVICAIAMSCTALWAQEDKKPTATVPVPAVRVFSLKPGNLNRVMGAVVLIAGENNVRTNGDTVVVKTIPEYMPAVEKLVKDLDVDPLPMRNVELTFYILQGSREPLPDADPIPPELQPTVAQLKNTFGFQGFRLFDTAMIRGRNGQESVVTGHFSPQKGASSGYRIYVKHTITSESRPAVVHFDHLQFTTGFVVANSTFTVEINANIDIKEGQKVVVGKSGIDGNQSAIILVCTTRLVD